MKTTITFEIDTEALAHYTDAYLAQLWHVAQANPADAFAAREPGQLAEEIGREIIRRWLAATPPELWQVEGRHFDIGQKERNAAESINPDYKSARRELLAALTPKAASAA